MRSHVDPCTFVAHLHIAGGYVSDELAETLRSFKLEQGKSPEQVLRKLALRSQQIEFHETYHFWQGLRLPFLYRYALLSFRTAIQAFREVAPYILEGQDPGLQLPHLERLGIDFCIARGGPGLIYFGGSSADFPDGTREVLPLTALALLECATSLAEYQWTCTGDVTDPSSLRRWSKRNPASLNLFWFAARFLGDERTALRLLLPLINVAFCTSVPERAFFELLGRAWPFLHKDPIAPNFLAQPEPCRWHEVCESWLDSIAFDSQPDADADLLSNDFHRVTLQYWVGGGFTDGKGGSLAHPFLAPKARKWEQLQAKAPVLGMVMDQPAWVDREVVEGCLEAFSPSLNVYRFHFADGTSRVIFTGEGRAGDFSTFEIPDASQWRGFIADILTMYGAIRSLSGAHFDGQQRTCHHSQCPHYAINLCNTYPIIPADFRDCGFPARLSRLANEWRTKDGNS